MNNIVFLKQSFILILSATAVYCQNGFDENWWIPDVCTTKHDPYDLISSNFGQPDGQYNWNTNQFTLMNRTSTKCTGCTQNGKNVAVQNLKLYVNDEEYFIKGVCYNPVPLGVQNMDFSSGAGGAGLCSQRRTPFATDDYKSACYDSDYFDGSIDPTRVPAGPSNGWFTSLWERDFPIIKSMGANTLRVYNSNPTTFLYTEEVILGIQTAISGSIAPPPVGKYHVPFMNAAAAYGLMVIYPLIGDQTLMTTMNQSDYERLIQNQIDEIGNHPALLMYTLGNELNLAGDPELLTLVNTYIAFAKQYMMAKWGRSIPITHAIVDDPTTYNMLYASLNVDVFTSNAGYRGLGFSDLWTGAQTPGFSGLGPLSVQYNKPNFIGEMGWMQINGTQTASPVNAGWFNIKWQQLIAQGTYAGCIGGAFFEYSDEPYSKADPLQQSMGTVSCTVSTTTLQATLQPIPPYTPTVWPLATGFTGANGVIPETQTNFGSNPATQQGGLPTDTNTVSTATSIHFGTMMIFIIVALLMQ